MADKRSRTTLLTDRPLSVYDNLTAVQNNTNHNNNAHNNYQQHHRQEPSPTTYSFPDISFKFDDDNDDKVPRSSQNPYQIMEDPRMRIPFGSSQAVNNVASLQPINDQNSPDMYSTMTSPQPPTTTHIRYSVDDHHHHPHHQLHQQQQQQQHQRLNHQQQQQQQQQQTPHNYNNHNNEYATVTKPIAQYENVAETIKLRNSFRASKPVISDAKSSFFGLDTPKSSPHASTQHPPSSPQHQHHSHQQDRSIFAANIMDQQNDRAPLILGTPSSPLSAIVPTKSNGEYQNIPSNSAFFHHRIPAPAIDHQTPSVEVMATTTSNNASPSGSNMSTRSVSAASSPPKSPTNDDHHGCQLGVVDELDYHQQNNNGRSTSEHNPSQAVYMTTTVPQNIKGSNIAGRHTPTRTSLRHSRMIVVNKNYQAPRKPNPLQISHPFLAKLMLIVQLLTGTSIIGLSIWVLLWAPSTRTRDNPYWSGIPLVFAGILGLLLVEFRRTPRDKMREHCFTFIRLNSTSASVLALVASFGAFVFATIHLDNVTSANTVCVPSDIFTSQNAFCICMFGTNETDVESMVLQTVEEGRLTAGGSEFQYRDLSCAEVRGAWKYILFAFTLLNMIAFIVSFLYLMMLCFPKRRKHGRNGSLIPEALQQQQQQHQQQEKAVGYTPVRSVL